MLTKPCQDTFKEVHLCLSASLRHVTFENIMSYWIYMFLEVYHGLLRVCWYKQTPDPFNVSNGVWQGRVFCLPLFSPYTVQCNKKAK